jgi:aryl-alcohol dehydrogenase-like predicted oxidoreductase
MGAGTMLFGESTSPAEAHHLLSAAADMGIQFIDSAEMYPVPQRAEMQGKSESILGDWLKVQRRYHSQAWSNPLTSLNTFMRSV